MGPLTLYKVCLEIIAQENFNLLKKKQRNIISIISIPHICDSESSKLFRNCYLVSLHQVEKHNIVGKRQELPPVR